MGRNRSPRRELGALLGAVLMFSQGCSSIDPDEASGERASAGKTMLDPSPFGMNGLKLTHTWNAPNAFEAARNDARHLHLARARWDRFEIWWSLAEPERGTFDWAFFDRCVEVYEQEGLNVLAMLGFSSAWSGGKLPLSDEDQEDFANFVYQAVRRYKKTIRAWQIWNEPNIPTFWNPPDVEAYTRLLKKAAAAVKRADPTAVVVGAPTSGVDLGFLEGVRSRGGLDALDVVAIHPYSMAGDPTHQRLADLLVNTRALVGDKPIWITEVGWRSEGSTSESKQAAWLLQTYAIALAHGVEKVFWFCLRDWSEAWGLMVQTPGSRRKPAFWAYWRLALALGDDRVSFLGYLRLGSAFAAPVFQPLDGPAVAVLWSMSGGQKWVRLPVDRVARVQDGASGQPLSLTPAGWVKVDGGPLLVTLEGDPADLDLGTAPSPFAVAAGRSLLFNGSFEEREDDLPVHWLRGSFDGSLQGERLEVIEEAHQGAGVAIAKATATGAAWESIPIPVEPGAPYYLRGWVSKDGATGENHLAIRWYSGNMWTLLGEAKSVQLSGTADWRPVQVTGSAPPGAALARIVLRSAGNQGRVSLDDVVFLRRD